MAQHRRKFSPQFKAEAIQFVLQTGRPVTLAEKAAFIDAQKANYPIIWMCQILNVSRSSFYAWREHVDSAATTRRGELAALITRAFEDSRHTYGCRRITMVLNRAGHACSVGLWQI